MASSTATPTTIATVVDACVSVFSVKIRRVIAAYLPMQSSIQIGGSGDGSVGFVSEPAVCTVGGV